MAHLGLVVFPQSSIWANETAGGEAIAYSLQLDLDPQVF